jgi:hypothetical protein
VIALLRRPAGAKEKATAAIAIEHRPSASERSSPSIGGAAMLIDHDHPPGRFDAGHCWACARQAGMLDHHDRVQDQEINLRQAREWAWAAHRYAIWAMGSSAVGILLAAAALPTR